MNRLPTAAPDHAAWMRLALQEARAAAQAGEVPVGAVLVKDGVLLGRGRNAPVGSHDPTAHAEVAALRQAAARLGNYRLDGCTLYVTLEPCAMCSGAMLHARLAHVVYGAPDPKTGVAGSVFDLFAQAPLNHQTQVIGGVLEAECAALLQDFFRQRRSQQRRLAQPLREDALRTPPQCFAGWLDAPGEGQYVSDLPALAGLRLHYRDLGPQGAGHGWVLLHPVSGWGHAMLGLAQALAAVGERAIAPDLIGFGQSDKPKKETAHSLDWHAQVLLELARRQQLESVVLLAPAALLPLAERLEQAGLLRGLLTLDMPALPPSAGNAPFPDSGHRAGPRALARLLGAAAPPPWLAQLPHWHGTLAQSPQSAHALVAQAVKYFAP